jgi:hypothetical protein
MIDLFLTLALAAACGGDDPKAPEPCPHQVLDPVEIDVRAERPQECRGSFSATFNGITVSTPMNTCPLFVVVLPPHDSTKHQAGSNTYTVPEKTVSGKLIYYECHEYWLMGLFPITVSVNCVRTGETNTGAFTHYVQRPCPVEPK